jgi:class 3 adenylate cyclase/tetratricopeptide (TPR) repeat protein
MTGDQPAYALSWSSLLPRLARYLPLSNFNHLRVLSENLAAINDDQQQAIASEIMSAVRSLDPLQRVLINYMPRYLLQLNPTPGQPHGEILEGTFIFADVTGFTALTELLSRQGQGQGYETMNQIMNRLFTTVLDPLIASGGDLLFFIGDAVLLYFPKQARDQDVWQAIRAGLRMERAIQPFASFETEFGSCSLTMSAGVERGLAYAGLVGDRQRMELLVSGPGIYRATAAEQRAEPGQVALGEQAAAIVAGHFRLAGPIVLDDWGDDLGDYEIAPPTSRRSGGTAIFGLTIPEALEALDTTLRRVERLAPFLPEDMLARLVNTERQRRLQPELRPAAIQFINIIGLEELALERGAELATTVFQRFFLRAQEIVTQHEGVISQVDAWSKGFILVNTFGTPRAHEGTNQYAVSAALQLGRALDQVNREFGLEPPLQQRSGITQGLIFTGEIGAVYRRESVIAGSAVNRAARLMNKAQPGQIILDSDIWDKASAAFVGEPLPPVTLKGIEGQVVIVNVREVRRGTRLLPLERPLLGREVEQARLTQALDVLLPSAASISPDGVRPKGSAWLISGETGLGKTALVSDLAELARQRDLTVLVGRCQPHSKHIPLFPWIDLLTGWLDLDEQTQPGLQRTRLASELASLGLAVIDKTLANLLGLPALDNIQEAFATPPLSLPVDKPVSLLSVLTDKVQSDQPVPPAQPSWQTVLEQRLAGPRQAEQTLWTRLEERVSGPHAIIELLKKLAERQPMVMIIEDIDWIEWDSLALLTDLLQQLPGLPLLVALTSREAWPVHNQAVPLPLSQLSDDALIQIAQRALGASALDETLGGWISERANGNPLYVQELCQALEQAEAILLDRETGEVRWTGYAPNLPLSLHALLLARLDELALPTQEVLKRAAVIGLTFEAEGLVKLSHPHLNALEVQTALEGAVAASFITAIDETAYRFNHPLLQETVYATLAFSQRQRWHTRVGDWLAESRSEVDQFLELIATHYLRGTDAEKAAHLGRRAGDKARERGAYIGAAEYYAQVLALPNAPLAEQASAAEGLGDVLALQRDYRAASTAYAQAVELGSLDAPGKQAIISGDLEVLARTEFTPALRPWADGARAWLLAQQGQVDAALKLLQPVTQGVDELAQLALEALTQTLTREGEVGPYEQWLERFVQTALSHSSPVMSLSQPN